MELNLKKFNKQQLEEYYGFLDLIIERFGLQEGDERLVFNLSNKNQIVFTIGQRYVWITGTNEEDFKFEVISEKPISNKSSDFDGKPTAFWNKFDDISEVLKHQQSIFNAIEKELNRTQISGFLRHNKEELEKMAFDADFRKEVLDQLRLNNLTLRLQASNPFLIYSDKRLNGQDPEFFRSGGVAYPITTQYTLTINVGI